MIKNVNKQRGVTLIEIFIVLAIVGVVVIGAGSFLGGGCGQFTGKNKERAMEQAREFVNASPRGADVHNILCQNQDSNMDGYVTCTVFYKDNSRDILDCAGYSFTGADGCKPAEQKMRIDGGMY